MQGACVLCPDGLQLATGLAECSVLARFVHGLLVDGSGLAVRTLLKCGARVAVVVAVMVAVVVAVQELEVMWWW